MAEKVTTMVLKVDLQCCRCTKKTKKVLAKFPEIRSQTYDEEKNTVTITVVCCSPENFRANLCCKGGKTIKCIEIKEPVKSKKDQNEDKSDEKKNEETTGQEKVPDPAPPACVPVHVYPHPVLVCCGPCCVGNPGGPCFHGCGRPVPCCDGYGYRYGCGCGCGCNRRCYVSGCDEYFISEGNTSGCAIV